jgi:antitoxin (DNA-binding transcriptional repressor) of toxin-antitoxin stability system
MRQVSLREFRTRGAKALAKVPRGETVLLAGQQGSAYFLVPVMGDIAAEELELRRGMAKSSLREQWRLIAEAGLPEIRDEEIEQEIDAVRTDRLARQKRRKS